MSSSLMNQLTISEVNPSSLVVRVSNRSFITRYLELLLNNTKKREHDKIQTKSDTMARGSVDNILNGLASRPSVSSSHPRST